MVKATTTTTGTGTIELGASPTGFLGFDEFTDTDSVYVLVIDNAAAPTQWEVFESVYSTGTPDTLSRGTLISSSTGSRITFSSGTKTVGAIAPSQVFETVAEVANSDLVTTGSSNTYAVVTARGLTPYDGHTLTVEANHTNSGAATLNPDATGALAIKTTFGDDLWPGAMVSGGKYLLANDGTNYQLMNPSSHQKVRDNLLLNGDFIHGQRGTSFTGATTPNNNDGNYTYDGWVLISDGNDVVDLSQLLSTSAADLPTGARSGIRATIQTGSKQFGLVQVVEANNCQSVIGGVASLSSQLKLSAGIAKMRAAILSWSGTADATTSDVVGTWAGSGTEPTWATSWTREGSISDLTATGAWTDLSVSNAAIDTASTKQIAVVIWLDDVNATVSDTIDFSNIKVEEGASPTEFVAQEIGDALIRCKRRYQVSQRAGIHGWATAATHAYIGAQLPVTMRAIPTIALIDTSVIVRQGNTTSFTSTGSGLSGAARIDSWWGEISGFTGLAVNGPVFTTNDTPIVSLSAEVSS